jgi:USP8 dimerisation domain
MTEESKEDPHEPSAARRRQLREAEANPGTIPTVSNFFPIERYYDASEKVLQSFETAYERKRLDEAYVYGIRFCEFCVNGIVQHDYYRSSKFAARKMQTNARVDAVLKKLDQVAAWMDKEEIEKMARREAILKQQREDRARKQREIEEARLAEIERRLAQQKADFSSFHNQDKVENVEESAMAKLQRLGQPTAPPPPPQHDSISKKHVSFQQEPDGQIFSSDSGEALPPPILPPELRDEITVLPPPPPDTTEIPPSYQEIIAKQSYFGPGAVGHRAPSASYTAPQTPGYDAVIMKPVAPKIKVSLRQYISQASLKYSEYLQKGRIQISALNTYQGRTSGSTNGCTVISACVVSKHLQGRGITDTEIQAVIDRDCIPLLSAIRSKLGLGGSSLIIPSDVHDYMVDHHLLFQHKFVGAAGGNICDQSHLQEVYKMLEGEPGKTQHLKAGATLFFKEHVISIVKFPTSPSEAVYDMVDSLPTASGRASRTRCTSIKALKVLLEWYTSHKFSDSNITYIERNRWDDAMADFDPRVFQAFVWADLPKPK